MSVFLTCFELILTILIVLYSMALDLALGW